MRVAASRIGFEVPQDDFVARLAAIYERTSLLVLPDQRLIAIVPSELGAVPYGISVDLPRGFSFAGSVSIDVCAALRGGVLRIGQDLCIDLRVSRPWLSQLGQVPIDPRHANVCRAWEQAWSVLSDQTTIPPLVDCLGTGIRRMWQATQELDLASARIAISSLVGLGEGLTPAGDDYLIGHFAGLWSCPRNGTRDQFLEGLGALLREQASCTHRVSRMYLKAAAAGQVAERLAAVAGRIAAGADEHSITEAVVAAVAVGHSSGVSGVLGLLCGCAAWGYRNISPTVSYRKDGNKGILCDKGV